MITFLGVLGILALAFLVVIPVGARIINVAVSDRQARIEYGAILGLLTALFALVSIMFWLAARLI